MIIAEVIVLFPATPSPTIWGIENRWKFEFNFARPAIDAISSTSVVARYYILQHSS